jgi:hypothetical protein
MPLLRLIAMAALVSGPAILPVAALATPLDKQECASLQVERKKLLTPEMKAALERGPDWVKDHLDPAKIDQVRQFLAVEEKVEFRCRGGGVAKVAPEIMTLPDRNPNRPVSASADAEPAVTASEDSPPNQGAAEPDDDTKPSQTVADSDKTPPSKLKATR